MEKNAIVLFKEDTNSLKVVAVTGTADELRKLSQSLSDDDYIGGIPDANDDNYIEGYSGDSVIRALLGTDEYSAAADTGLKTVNEVKDYIKKFIKEHADDEEIRVAYPNKNVEAFYVEPANALNGTSELDIFYIKPEDVKSAKSFMEKLHESKKERLDSMTITEALHVLRESESRYILAQEIDDGYVEDEFEIPEEEFAELMDEFGVDTIEEVVEIQNGRFEDGEADVKYILKN